MATLADSGSENKRRWEGHSVVRQNNYLEINDQWSNATEWSILQSRNVDITSLKEGRNSPSLFREVFAITCFRAGWVSVVPVGWSFPAISSSYSSRIFLLLWYDLKMLILRTKSFVSFRWRFLESYYFELRKPISGLTASFDCLSSESPSNRFRSPRPWWC